MATARLTEETTEDQILTLNTLLQEVGLTDDEKCEELSTLTKIINNNSIQNDKSKSSEKNLHRSISDECLERILRHLDIRQSQKIRSHATLAISAYLSAADAVDSEKILNFLFTEIKKQTSEDYTVAFSAAASLFAIVPDLISKFFLSEIFVSNLQNLISKNWRGGQVERAALEMLNSACINASCRSAIRNHFLEWLIQKIQCVSEFDADDISSETLKKDGLEIQNQFSELTRNLAAIILAKLQAVSQISIPETEEPKILKSITTEELSIRFKNNIISGFPVQNSIEGLAYTSLQVKSKEILVSDKDFLKALINALSNAPTKSPEMYGALTILVNLTSYLPVQPEEQKRMNQLKAYANASKISESNQLDNDEHVSKRCLAIFEAGVIPVLVTHARNSSISSLALAISIICSLARTPKIRGEMAQQGAVKLLLQAFPKFSNENASARRASALALARILITTNPSHIFGGSNPLSITSAVRPLILILSDDPTVEHRDLLPVFESLLALTNLASTDDTARNPIIRLAFSQLEELLLSNNLMVTRATVELICNLVQSPEGVAKFADGGRQASHRIHILLALSDAEDFATRRAAGGALASLTQWDTAVNSILERDRGAYLLLRLCEEDQEDIRHRGVVCVLNVISAPGEIGKWGLTKIKTEGGIDKLKECLKKSKNQEVLNVGVDALKLLLASEKLNLDP